MENNVEMVEVINGCLWKNTTNNGIRRTFWHTALYVKPWHKFFLRPVELSHWSEWICAAVKLLKT